MNRSEAHILLVKHKHAAGNREMPLTCEVAAVLDAYRLGQQSALTTREERLDELLALASHAGMLGSEAIACELKSIGARNAKVRRIAQGARYVATAAEQKLAAARARFLADYGER